MITYTGSGTSTDDPICIVGASGHIAAIAAEYTYLRQNYGTQGTDWTLQLQTLIELEHKMIDLTEIRLADGRILQLYFDITPYWGSY